MTEEINTNYLGVTPGIANYIVQEVGDVDLSEYYTKSEIDSKIDSIGAGGEVVLNNYYTKSEVDSKIEAIDNENTDSLWTLENGQTLSYTNPNVDTNYPALSLIILHYH